MWTRKFWKDAGERAAKSVAQALLLLWGGDELANAWQVDWATAGGVALAAAALSVLSSVVSVPFGDSTSASLVDDR